MNGLQLHVRGPGRPKQRATRAVGHKTGAGKNGPLQKPTLPISNVTSNTDELDFVRIISV